MELWGFYEFDVFWKRHLSTIDIRKSIAFDNFNLNVKIQRNFFDSFTIEIEKKDAEISIL